MNKKLLQLASMLLVAACLCINFTACGDDDDEKEGNGAEQNDNEPANSFGNDYAWVDLGLPSGLKWATCNVGASNPWEHGASFAWGETIPKSFYAESTYKWYKNEGLKYDYEDLEYDFGFGHLINYTIIKYNNDSKFGIVDNRDALDLVDDAAAVNMGSGWRMPTIEEQHELIANCYWEWMENYNGKGVAGFIVYKVKNVADKGKAKLKYKDNIGVYVLDERGYIWVNEEYKTTLMASYSLSDTHIFLPALYSWGYGYVGNYWSSSLREDYPYNAYGLYFESDGVHWSSWNRAYEQSVRGVVE